MAEGAKLIRERHISVLLFPEGGRTEAGMRPFREGAAYIAIKAGVRVGRCYAKATVRAFKNGGTLDAGV